MGIPIGVKTSTLVLIVIALLAISVPTSLYFVDKITDKFDTSKFTALPVGDKTIPNLLHWNMTVGNQWALSRGGYKVNTGFGEDSDKVCIEMGPSMLGNDNIWRAQLINTRIDDYGSYQYVTFALEPGDLVMSGNIQFKVLFVDGNSVTLVIFDYVDFPV